jgi:hypothetical protein
LLIGIEENATVQVSSTYFHPQILREIRIIKADGDAPEQRFAMLV